MLATGLRRRFFALILSVLVVMSTSSLLLYRFLLRTERLKLIDQQVRETASVLIDSQLNALRHIDFDRADEIISEELGESRIGKFFIIKNGSGDVVFESTSASLLPDIEIPKTKQWFEITQNDKFIRGLNLKLPKAPGHTLQVGVVLDETILNPSYFSSASLLFSAIVILLGMIASYLLTSFLLRPIAKLDHFLSDVATASRKHTLLPFVPVEIARNPDSNSKDEFERVIAGLNTLIAKVNKNYELSRLWGYQMAHELKTPLSVANIEIERLQKQFNLSTLDFEPLIDENKRISETINSFLGWAELENSNQQKHLYMNQLASLIQDTVSRLAQKDLAIEIKINAAPEVAANPQHLIQLIQNLVMNAVIHSSSHHIVVTVEENGFSVTDEGVGFSEKVIERLGEPFNKGNGTLSTHASQRSGHGLGLAWAYSICRTYNWTLELKNLAPGARATVAFITQPLDESITPDLSL